MCQQTEYVNPDHLAQRANQLFVENGLTCGEACLQSAAEALGIESPLLPGIAIALGGGLGMQGDVCGAVTGCALALSLAAAGKTKDYAERKKLAMPAMGRLYQAFAERCGAVRCSDICGLDLRTPEGMAGLVAGARAEKCAPVVVVAARLLGEEIRRMSGSLK